VDLGLKGRTALVMGASQGLGQATAMQLAEEGAHVILVARREDVLTSVQQQIEDAGGSAEVACCDLFDRASRQALCQLIENLPRLDVLVANSGGPAPGMAPGIASEVWTQEFDAMVLGLIEIIDTAVIRMKDAKFGRILVIGSSGIVVPIPKLAVSNTLRSAVGGYVKTLSEQVASHGVTCNMVFRDVLRPHGLKQSMPRQRRALELPKSKREQFIADDPDRALWTSSGVWFCTDVFGQRTSRLHYGKSDPC
jgi:3-oxoacyl-[acyl-carrier protein] reductase